VPVASGSNFSSLTVTDGNLNSAVSSRRRGLSFRPRLHSSSDTPLATAHPAQPQPEALTLDLRGPPMRFREFSDSSDHAGRIPNLGTRAGPQYVSIGCEPVPPHEVEQPSCVHCCSRPI
jgi:hypothetical protein